MPSLHKSLLLLAVLTTLLPLPNVAAQSPNVILFLVDDVRWFAVCVCISAAVSMCVHGSIK